MECNKEVHLNTNQSPTSQMVALKQKSKIISNSHLHVHYVWYNDTWCLVLLWSTCYVPSNTLFGAVSTVQAIIASFQTGTFGKGTGLIYPKLEHKLEYAICQTRSSEAVAIKVYWNKYLCFFSLAQIQKLVHTLTFTTIHFPFFLLDYFLSSADNWLICSWGWNFISPANMHLHANRYICNWPHIWAEPPA